MNAPKKAWTYMWAHAPVNASHSKYPALAFHSSEIPFVFHILDAEGADADNMMIHGAGEVALSSQIVSYWRNMAAVGDPNGNGAAAGNGNKATTGPVWTAYERNASDSWMLFGDLATSDDSVSMHPGLRSSRCDFWDRVQGWGGKGSSAISSD